MLERFFTDTLSNTVVLDSLDQFSSQYSPSSLIRDSQPLRLLLHERTHHASFDSRVGAALGAISTFSANHAITTGDPQTLSLSERDLLMARAAYQLLEPLVEGLALFAEHDGMHIGDASPVSAVTVTMLQLLFADKNEPVENALHRLATTLCELRATDDWIDAKTRLLTQPLSERPAYLLGYLAVKGLFKTLSKRCPRFVNPDLFLLLMLDYWFDDARLAEMLARFIEPGPAARAQAEWLALVSYLEERTVQLIEHVDEYLDELLAFLEAADRSVYPLDQPGGPSYRNSASTDDMPLGRMWRVAALSQFTSARFFDFRTDFRFASSSVTVHIAPDGTVRLTTPAGRELAKDIPAVANAGVNRVLRGAIEAILTPQAGGRVVLIISALDGLVAVRDWNSADWNPSDLIEYFDGFPSSQEVLATKSRLAEGQSQTASHAAVGDALNVLTKLADQAVIHLYSQWALPGQPSEQRHRFAATLAREGFAAVLDPHLCRTMAVASLQCGGLGWTYVAETEAESRDAGALTEELQAINRAVRPLFGRDVFSIGDGSVWSVV